MPQAHQHLRRTGRCAQHQSAPAPPTRRRVLPPHLLSEQEAEQGQASGCHLQPKTRRRNGPLQRWFCRERRHCNKGRFFERGLLWQHQQAGSAQGVGRPAQPAARLRPQQQELRERRQQAQQHRRGRQHALRAVKLTDSLAISTAITPSRTRWSKALLREWMRCLMKRRRVCGPSRWPRPAARCGYTAAGRSRCGPGQNPGQTRPVPSRAAAGPPAPGRFG